MPDPPRPAGFGGTFPADRSLTPPCNRSRCPPPDNSSPPRELAFIAPLCYFSKGLRCGYGNKMPTQISPAASLSIPQRLPAAGTLFRTPNYLICIALWSIRQAIFRGAANFLPALRERRVTQRRPNLHSLAVPPLARRIVFPASFNPAFSGWGLHALPKRRVGL